MEDTVETVEQTIRKSVVHRFIDQQCGVSQEKLEKVVEPLVQYILHGLNKK